MGYKPINTAKFRKWLKSRVLILVRTEASHEIWDFPDDSLIRPIIFRGAKKEIPGLHVYTNLKTLGIDYKTFEREINNL